MGQVGFEPTTPSPLAGFNQSSMVAVSESLQLHRNSSIPHVLSRAELLSLAIIMGYAVYIINIC
jgi:hypothetical protein